MSKAYSDRYMLKLFREAVIAWHGERCVFCGRSPVQIHHIIKRKHWLLRYDLKNGLPLCIPCHNQAETLYFRKKIIDFIGPDWISYLDRMELQFKKQYLQDNNMSENEFLKMRANELKEIIKGAE